MAKNKYRRKIPPSFVPPSESITLLTTLSRHLYMLYLTSSLSHKISILCRLIFSGEHNIKTKKSVDVLCLYPVAHIQDVSFDPGHLRSLDKNPFSFLDLIGRQAQIRICENLPSSIKYSFWRFFRTISTSVPPFLLSPMSRILGVFFLQGVAAIQYAKMFFLDGL